ncbi:MAG: polysaccharide deacetylase family protein [Bacteroidetes bacterium]|nr:polysaccharide deacetylase family protein [Bacteroidota bacterium]
MNVKKIFLPQPKSIVKRLFPKALWQVNTTNKSLYLTFDDGPIPDLTEWILDELKAYNAKATFFCVGANILKNPVIFERIINEGHTVANHTMNHIKGFKNSTSYYLKEVEACDRLVKNNFFRPPYGQLKPLQYRALHKLGYKIVFWDVISYDYEKITHLQCAQNVIKNAKPGSIILFHDNIKAYSNVKYALRKSLKHFSQLGYSFKKL